MNLPSELTAISRLTDPSGFVPTTVPGNAVNTPVFAMANPEMVDEPALEVYTKLPSGATTFQQFAAPNVGTLLLMGDRVPLAAIS